MIVLKFRAYDHDGGRMYYSDLFPKLSLFFDYCERRAIPNISDGFKGMSDYMQFTGRYDANQKEIYHLDFIDSYQNGYTPTLVEFDDFTGEFETTNYHSTLSLFNSMSSDTKVLGNIYENPDLCNV